MDEVGFIGFFEFTKNVVFSRNRFDGSYMAIKNQYKSLLTQEQVILLSEYIVDIYGTGLPEEELVESISVVLERDVSAMSHDFCTDLDQLFPADIDRFACLLWALSRL